MLALLTALALAADVHTDAEAYWAGEAVTITWASDPGWPGQAWVGIVPAHVPHGSSAENDRNDVAYAFIPEGEATGIATLPAPSLPGEWTVRLHDGRGAEVAHAAFTVRTPDYSSSTLAVDPPRAHPLDTLTVTWSVPQGLPPRAWVGLLPAGAPHANAAEADAYDVAYRFLSGKTSGTWQLPAPEQADTWHLTLFSDEGPSGQLVTDTRFSVVTVDASSARLWLDGPSRVLPGEYVRAAFEVPEGMSPKAWLALVPADVPHGDGDVVDQHDMAWMYLDRHTSDVGLLQAPTTGGAWTVRLVDAEVHGREVATVDVEVADTVLASDMEQRLNTDGHVAVYGILFAAADASLRPDSAPVLQQILTLLQTHPGLRLRVEGHTDSQGASSYNQRLSEQRAASVRAWLVEHGVDGGRLQAVGIGETTPIGPNETEAGRALNRRVELVRL